MDTFGRWRMLQRRILCMSKRFVAVIIAAATAWAPQLLAQGYPGKPIRVVIENKPASAGGRGSPPI